MGVQAAQLLFWCIVWSSTDLHWHPYNQSCQLQLLESDPLLLWSSLFALASGKEWPMWSQHHFSLPSQKEKWRITTASAQCCQIILLPHGLDRSSMSGKLKLNGGQAKPAPFMQRAFKRSYWLHAGDSLMLQCYVSLHGCRVFQVFPFQKFTRREVGRWTD